MDQPQQTYQPQQPGYPQQPVYYAPPTKRSPLLFLGGFLLLLAGIIAGWGTIQSRTVTGPSIQPSPVAVASPTIETRKLSAIATSSAFLQLTQSVDALNTQVNGLNLDDTNISPPSIELSLGFSN